jgi:hypothetical protein
MNPKYSDSDRHKIVINFIAKRGQGLIPIIDFSPLIRYFADITPLREIKKTGYEEIYDDDGSIKMPIFPNMHVSSNRTIKRVPCIGGADAEEYFNWLIWIVIIDEKATDETKREAVNQLFWFIFVLRDKIQVNLDDFLRAGFEWVERMNIIDENLASLKSDLQYLEKGNDSDHFDYNEDHKTIEGLKADSEKMTVILERIRNWQKEHQPYLNKIKKDQENIDKAMKGEPIGKEKKR